MVGVVNDPRHVRIVLIDRSSNEVEHAGFAPASSVDVQVVERPVTDIDLVMGLIPPASLTLRTV